eukprot:TRINITY_DN27942_c0_g1_i1.p1 TRINITY_DN27942_c0_g1~~TRINITY_DN27942_c0_g1_i1.p1  ORF type:complete len:209 (+),score=12.63 TRINITY_DN27942_c0_g1_i1:96-629(+)
MENQKPNHSVTDHLREQLENISLDMDDVERAVTQLQKRMTAAASKKSVQRVEEYLLSTKEGPLAATKRYRCISCGNESNIAGQKPSFYSPQVPPSNPLPQVFDALTGSTAGGADVQLVGLDGRSYRGQTPSRRPRTAGSHMGDMSFAGESVYQTPRRPPTVPNAPEVGAVSMTPIQQ